MFFLPTKIENKMWKKLFKVVSEQNSINDLRRGTMTFLVSLQISDCITRFLFCSRHLLFNVMERFWAVVSCLVWPQHTVWCPQSWLFLEAQSDVLPCHVIPCHVTAQPLFAKRRHSPDDVVWWRSAIRPTCSYLLTKIPHSIRLALFNDHSQQTQTL